MRAFGSLAFSHAFLLYFSSRSNAQSTTDIDWEAYDRGDLGPNPLVNFVSSDDIAPLVHVGVTSPACDSSAYLLLTYGAQFEPVNQAMLLDSTGQLVWAHRERGNIHNVQVQQYKSKNYITYWVGDDDHFGHGHGYYKMLDETYTLAYTISAGNSLDGDFHEFTITSEDTALVTSYVKIPWDLTDRERADGFIWDCVFQEIDIETDKVLFEWRASDHFKFTDMVVDSWQPWTGREDDPWDWFHLNSVDKDSKGNYLIAARYSNAITYIDGSNGDILWNIGGKHNKFIDITRGDAVTFVDPHMARWTLEDAEITVFDNIAFWSYAKKKRVSHGARLTLDTNKWVAKLQKEYIPLKGVYAPAGGSMQPLENGNYFLGFGTDPYYAEFSRDGKVLCDAQYAPSNITDDEDPTSNLAKSYRISKHSWSGFPTTAPKAKIQDGALYVSWNGATEVHAWKVIAKMRGGHYVRWKTIGISAKTGFETKIPYDQDSYEAFHLTALDANHIALQSWYTGEECDLIEIWDDTMGQQILDTPGGLYVVFVALAIFLWINRRAILCV